MYFYSNEILEQRKNKIERSRNGGRGDWIALTKFIIVVAVVFGTIGLILHHHNQVKQEMVDLHTSLLELKRTNQELEHRAQNLNTELERQSSSDISERARRLGLRPTRSSQLVRDVRVVRHPGVPRQTTEVVSNR